MFKLDVHTMEVIVNHISNKEILFLVTPIDGTIVHITSSSLNAPVCDMILFVAAQLSLAFKVAAFVLLGGGGGGGGG